MSFMPAQQTTSIARHTNEDIFIREKSLCQDLIGKLSFTELMFFQIIGRMPTNAETSMVDACLVTLMEHGMTPSALATRLVYSSATESIQGAVAAGIMAVGSTFVGTMEGCAALLARAMAAEDLAAECDLIAREHRAQKKPIPGFGHHMHKPDDPRSIRLFEVADELNLSGANIAAIKALSAAIDQVYGKHITINATGAIGACLGDCAVPPEIMRGFAIITRCAGLVGHVHEEQKKPAMRAIWEAGDEAVNYQAG